MAVASLLGTKIALNEFAAFDELGKMRAYAETNPDADDALSEKV